VVITREGRPTGTISRDSLLRWFRNWVISKGLALPSASYQASCGCNTTDTASGLAPRTPDIELAGQSAE
jgi:hypothetical protein